MSAKTMLAALLMAVLIAFLMWAIVDPAGVKRFASGNTRAAVRAV